MTDDQFRNRQMTVRVLDLCDECKTLREGVEARSCKSYWPSWSLSLASCEPCWESAKRTAAAEAEGLIIC
ncbi:hypothetical protein [Paraburkholderia elongata]|uniref:Uncharacterized protein n=1 Tax=Paraburkholderia elongata TaxID=2675747 RepID=A0A972SLB7_9BURK|nr:hypothetical protein [Paraburkholderia elongata]NPT59054.1 hypothetical protein [Paraburkholderia elongata]